MAHYTPELLQALHHFYTALNNHIGDIEVKNKSRLHCSKGCFSCCKDDLEVFGIEAENIRIRHQGLLKNNLSFPKGMCAFLNENGACRIYESRPYVCRTHGVPISFLQEDEEGVFELRDICPLNEEGTPLEELNNDELFQNNPWEEKLAHIQIIADQGEMHRVRLRDLFINHF